MPQHFPQRFFARIARNCGIQSRDCLAQSTDKDDIAEGRALRRDFTGCEMRRMRDIVTEFTKPVQRCIFDNRF